MITFTEPEYKEVEVYGKKFRAFTNGRIQRSFRDKYFREVKPSYHTAKEKKEYWRIKVKDKMFPAHRITASAYLGLDIWDTDKKIDHIDRNTKNNAVNNLRIVTVSENSQNMNNVKGFSLNRENGKYRARIIVNGKHICLGTHDTEDGAHNAYLEAKKKYHISNNDNCQGRREV